MRSVVGGAVALIQLVAERCHQFEHWQPKLYDPAARRRLAGDTILHADCNPSNIIITPEGELKMIDWAWPTRAAAWIDRACLVPRLISWGNHTFLSVSSPH